MSIRIVMYGEFVTDVYLISDGKPWGPRVRLEKELDYTIDRYPLEELLATEEEEGA